MAARRGRARHRAALAALPLAIAAGTVLLLCGAFSPGRAALLPRIAAWLLLLVAGSAAALRQLRFSVRSRGERAPAGWSAEAGLLLGLGALALLQATGGLQSPLVPLLYLLGASYALALPLPLAAGLILALLALHAALVLGPPAAAAEALRERWPLLASHAAFTVLFAALYHALLAARLRRAERAEREAVDRRVSEVERRARELRLVATADAGESDPEAPPGFARQRQLLSAVAEVEEALRGTLAVAEAALRPRTVAVFLLGESGETARLHECLSSSDRLLRGPLPAHEGALGAVLASGKAVRLHGAGPRLAYYDGAAPSAAFCGVPLREGGLARRVDLADEDTLPPAPRGVPEAGATLVREGALLGALIADRDAAFTADDERVLGALAVEMVRAIESERLLSAVRHEKEEKARFFRALEDLNRTRGVAEAAHMAVVHARRICPGLDLCVITLTEEGRRDDRTASRAGPPARGRLQHRVVAVGGEESAALQGLSFADNDGVVSSVVKLGHPLPGRDVLAMDRVRIFDRHTQVRGLSALKVFPLSAGASTLGTLVCGSRRRRGLPEEAQYELARLALQAAEALSRTRLFEQAERLATTDGLTGLLNRRTLNVQLAARLREAQRYKHPLSFVLLDIDHFKKVNDTFGHPAGDAVLRGVAAVAQAQARETDAVARYGGEEIAVILPETDAAGARTIAERLRAAVEASEHPTERGRLRCTVSIGVATLPLESRPAGGDVAALIEAADAALYRAKKGGRNRVESAPDRAAA
jgi:diguanylate cyclase (GGDEF)-like protein